MTIMTSIGDFPTADAFPKEVEVSKTDLKAFVASGAINKIDNHKEHFAISPCWLHDPGTGVVEEINHYTLGRWNKKLKAYVVAVHNIRNSESTAAMNEDHRWLHVDITATFYTFNPDVKLEMTGEIKKIGNSAAVCILFDVFTVTVFATDETELKSWGVSDLIRFKIYSFVHRRRGPILRARSVGVHHSKKFDEIEEPHVEYETAEPDQTLHLHYDRLDTSVDPVPENDTTFTPDKSKKKKKKKRKYEEDEDDGDDIPIKVEIKEEPETPVKKKKKKKKSAETEYD